MAAFSRSSFQRALAGECIQPCGVGFAIGIQLQHKRVIHHHRRGGHTERAAGVRIIEPQSAIPNQVSVQVQADDVVARVVGVDPLTIATRLRRGHAHRFVTDGSARGSELPFPQSFARGDREAQHVQPIVAIPAAGGEKHAVANDDGARDPSARERRFPPERLGFFQVNRQVSLADLHRSYRFHETAASRPAEAVSANSDRAEKKC